MTRSIALLLWSASLAGGASAQGREPDAPVVTQHRVALGARTLAYTAEVGRTAIRDVETGTPHGYVFYTAYRVPGATPRPLTFVWNGGPGANSATLAYEVAGPKRLAGDRLVDNAQTWLASTDLVFVDPVGTGFSRPAEARYAGEFYGTIGDVASITEFVRAWRLEHGAEDARLFLAGESWGAGRAANVGYQLRKRGVPLSGLLLISGGAGLAELAPPALAAALRVVDLAEAGRFHGRVTADAASVEAWARGVYAPALEHVETLTPAERDAVVAALSRYTGLPADKVDRKTLRITPRAYRTALLADRGKTLGLFDMRLTAAEPPERGDAVVRYLRHDLGYRSAEPYVGLEPVEQGYAPDGKYPASVGARWDYATGTVTPEQRAAAMAAAMASGAGPPVLGAPLPATAELVALDPKVRVLVAAGRYDSLNSCTANAETAKRLTGALASAVTFRCYTGGHMMYRDEATRSALGRDVAALVAK